MFVLRRALYGATTLLVVSLLIFLVTQALPADPASAIPMLEDHLETMKVPLPSRLVARN